ncbi:YisL family protein [Virgibacillus alimentarius]|uniref:YisL family protein n=1 Tax=Virgibacillus alimentarius TaxID=698769 RepID=UPI00049334DB|nr:YisL family protein [Virgibacillus alimentarius]
MAHMHITSWVLAFILIILVAMFYKQGKVKPGKILHMILRLDYLFILYTGGSLLGDYFSSTIGHTGEVIIKVIAGLWIIMAMEMIGVKLSKDKSAKGWVIQLVIAAIIAIALGFGRLPLGVLP